MFFIIIPQFREHFKPFASRSRRRRVYHQCEALHITNGLPLYIIKPQGNARRCVMPYAYGDSIHDCVVITYQSFGLDKKIPSLLRWNFLSCPFKIDPQSKFFRNRSVVFSQRIDLSLGDDELRKTFKKLSNYAGKRNLCNINLYWSFY